MSWRFQPAAQGAWAASGGGHHHAANNSKQKAQQAEAAKARKIADEKEAKEFKASLSTALPEIESKVTEIEQAVDAIAKAATPLIDSPPEEGDERTKQLDAIEKDAQEAQKKFEAVRGSLTNLVNKARKFAGETKDALKELNSLQVKITDSQKKVTLYKKFKADFQKLITARNAVAEVKETINKFGPEVDRVSGMAKSEMTEDEVVALDDVLDPANTTLSKALATISSKLQGADAATQSELESLRTKCSGLKKKLQDAKEKSRVPRQNAALHKGLRDAVEKVVKLEDLIKKCQEAEMPFLIGMEVLPKDESDAAFAASDKAATDASSAANATATFLSAQLTEARRHPKELQKSVDDQIGPLQKRASAAQNKIGSFRKDTAERKVSAMLAEAMEDIVVAEGKVAALVDATNVLAADKMEEAPFEDIKKATDASAVLEEAAQSAIDTAKKAVAKKQNSAKGGDFGKMFHRIKMSQEKIEKAKGSVQRGNRYVKSKAVYEEQSATAAQTEGDVAKAEKLCADVAKFTESEVKAMDECVAGTLKVLQTVKHALQSQLNTPAVKLKANFQELLDRRSKLQERMEKAKASAKVERETVLSAAFIKDAEAKLQAVDATFERTNEAELPFLKGIEVLPLGEAQSTVEASEKAAAAVREAIKLAQEYIRAKTAEVREFADKKSVTACYEGLNTRIRDANSKLAEFTKETKERKKNAQVRDADVKVADVEAALKAAVAFVEPFTKEDAKDMTEETASAPLGKFFEAEKAFKAKMTETRSFLGNLQREVSGNKSHADMLAKLLKRLGEAQQELMKGRKPIGAHEEKFTAKALVVDATKAVANLEPEVLAATKACAPMIEEGGEDYLVIARVAVLATALKENGMAKKLDEEAVYKEASGGKKLSQKKFLEYLAKLPETISREEVTFSEAQREAIFKHLDVDKDGFVSKDEFKNMFKARCIIRKEVSVTDGSSIKDSKAVGKVAPSDEVETFGVPVEDENNMLRTQCKLKDGTICWISVKQGNNVFAHHTSGAFAEFCNGIVAAVESAEDKVRKSTSEVEAKIKQATSSTSEASKVAKEELVKLRTQCNTAMTSLKTLKGKVNSGKESLKAKERAEKNAHIEAKEIKDAQVLFGVVTPKVVETEAAFKLIEEKAKPLIDAENSETFATPASLAEELEKLVEVVKTKAEEGRAVAKEQVQVAAKLAPQTPASIRAKKEINQYMQQLESFGRKSSAVLTKVNRLCDTIVKARVEKISTALRGECSSSGIDAEALFSKLAKDGKISIDAFCKKVASFTDLGIQNEHAMLVCKSLEAGGISQCTFLTFVQRYYKVVKEVALTDNFEISTCKSLRKVEKDELLVVLKGPSVEEKSGMERVYVKSILDGVVGWVSVKGNQGTHFIEEVAKPFYAVTRKGATLDKEVKVQGGAARALSESEVLELVEGPQKVMMPSTSRARVKATKDNIQGWVTIKDKSDITYAEPNTKLYVCKASVALTDSQSVTDAKVVRKLVAGEKFEAAGDVVEDASAGIHRVMGKAVKDGVDGWMTTKGSAGTVFAELVPKFYSVVKEVDLQKRQQGSSPADVFRKLEAGETFQVLEGPTEEKAPPETRIKVRATADKLVGWVSKSKVKSWSSTYRVNVPTPLQDTRGATEVTKTIRELAKGEQMEYIEGPFEEEKEIRMRGKAKKDGAVGWVSIKDAKGTVRLDC